MAYSIDEKDLKIIKVLQEHGDYTTRQIAKKVSLPITTIHNRIKKLKKEKIIEKFTIKLNQKAIDRGLLIYLLISVSLPILKEKKKTQYDVAKEIRNFYFVDKVDIVSGGTDLIATIRVKDVEEYDLVLLKRLQKVEGIEKTQSLIVIHER